MADIIRLTAPMAQESAKAAKLLLDLPALHAWLEQASPEDRAIAYDRAKMAVKVMGDFSKAVEAWALNTPGAVVSGYTVAPGNGRREWSVPEDSIVSTLAAQFGTPRPDFYALKSPAEVEKMLGGKVEAKTAVAKLVEVQPGPLGMRPTK